MNEVFHTTNQIPLIGLTFSIILISGFYLIGKIIIKNTILYRVLKNVSNVKYQALIVSISLIGFVSFPIALYLKHFSIFYFTSISYVIFFSGLFQIIKFSKNLIIIENFNKLKKLSIFQFLVLIGTFCYFLISSAPVTNADALDYHLFLSKFLQTQGEFPRFYNHFHNKLLGSGETITTIGLIVGSEQLNSIIQFAGLISIFGLLKKNSKNFILFFSIIIGCPVIIFFVSTIKPQLFYIAANALIFCLIFLDKSTKEPSENYYKLIFAIFILCVSVQAKFSFQLSFALISLFIILQSYKYNIFLKTAISSTLIFFISFTPFLIWKFSNVNFNIFDLVLKPFPITDQAETQFLTYLINAGRGDNPILGILFPDNLNSLTNSLGFGFLLFIFLFFNYKKNLSIILLISTYSFVGYFLGQPSSRFFLEPFIWVVLTLSQEKIKFNLEKIVYNILKIQYLLFLPAILYGALSLFPGSLNKDLMRKVLEKNANGYSLYRWANSEFKKLNYEGPVITTHRSISYSKNLPISNDVIWLTKINEQKYKKYADEVLRLKPRYILSYSETKNHEYFSNCDMVLVAKSKNVGRHASRKPFSRGKDYDGYIFTINTEKLPMCFEKPSK